MYSEIFNKPRNYLINNYTIISKLLNCPFCVGFWAGMFIAASYYLINPIKDILFLPLVSCGFCGFFISIFKKIINS